MKILGILLLMMLSSCKYCNEIKKFGIVERCAYSAQFDKCRCHEYNLNSGERVSDSVDLDAEYCDDIVGFKFSDWKIKITPKIKYNYDLYCDKCGKK